MVEVRMEIAMGRNCIAYRIAKWVPLVLSITVGCFNHIAASRGSIVLDSAAVGAALGCLSLLIAGYELLYRRRSDVERQSLYSWYAVLFALSAAAVYWNGVSIRAGKTQYENLRREIATPISVTTSPHR